MSQIPHLFTTREEPIAFPKSYTVTDQTDKPRRRIHEDPPRKTRLVWAGWRHFKLSAETRPLLFVCEKEIELTCELGRDRDPWIGREKESRTTWTDFEWNGINNVVSCPFHQTPLTILVIGMGWKGTKTVQGNQRDIHPSIGLWLEYPIFFCQQQDMNRSLPGTNNWFKQMTTSGDSQ